MIERGSRVDVRPKTIVTRRRIELLDAFDALTDVYPSSNEACTAKAIERLRKRHATVGRAIDQLGAAVATRDGFGESQSIGPDVAVQRYG